MVAAFFGPTLVNFNFDFAIHLCCHCTIGVFNLHFDYSIFGSNLDRCTVCPGISSSSWKRLTFCAFASTSSQGIPAIVLTIAASFSLWILAFRRFMYNLRHCFLILIVFIFHFQNSDRDQYHSPEGAKDRAKARRNWFLYKKGYIALSKIGLLRIRRILSTITVETRISSHELPKWWIWSMQEMQIKIIFHGNVCADVSTKNGMQNAQYAMLLGHKGPVTLPNRRPKARRLMVGIHRAGTTGATGRTLTFLQSLCKQASIWCCRSSLWTKCCFLSDAGQGQGCGKREEREERERTGQAGRSDFPVPSRGEELCAMGGDGYVCFHSVLNIVSQSICSGKLISGRAGSGMGGCATEGLSRSDPDARRDQASGRESGEGSWEERYQEPPPSHDLFREGQRSSERSLRSSTCSPRLMDETYGSRDPNLGATVGGISKTSSLPDGTSKQSSQRNHGDKPDYPTTQPYGRRHISTTSSLYPGSGCGGQCRRGSRQGGGNDEKQPPSCAQKLRRISWSGHRCSQDHRDCGGCRGDRGRQTIKKTAIIGALSLQICFVSLGRALGVECNPWHGACTSSVTDVCTDAYWSSFAVIDAACVGMDTSYQPLLPWTHSVIHEKRYVDPLQAVMNAFCLQWEVIKMHYNEFGRMFDILHVPPSLPPARSQRSQFMRHRDLHVGFVDQIDVLIGPEDSLDMHYIHLHSSALQDWTDKPWSKKRIKLQKNRKGSPDGDLIYDCPEVFHFPFSFPTFALEPLSKLAVSSRVKSPQYDCTNLMQTSHFKHAPHSEQDAAMLKPLLEGRLFCNLSPTMMRLEILEAVVQIHVIVTLAPPEAQEFNRQVQFQVDKKSSCSIYETRHCGHFWIGQTMIAWSQKLHIILQLFQSTL